MYTLEQAISSINDAATSSDSEQRVMRRFEVGKALHQGDVYLHMVADSHPRGGLWGSKQVAIGDTTGSRHVAEGDVEVYAGAALPDYFNIAGGVDPAAFLGPVVVARDTWCLAHPEHADHVLPAGVYQVSYQVDMLTRQRVAD